MFETTSQYPIESTWSKYIQPSNQISTLYTYWTPMKPTHQPEYIGYLPPGASGLRRLSALEAVPPPRPKINTEGLEDGMGNYG
jgi:hypothetical protein